jgi:hypothetical protein
MEYAAKSEYGLLYESEACANSSEEYEKFIIRVNEWLGRRHIILGEGTIDFIDYEVGPAAFRLKAPMLSGPQYNFVERISG